VAARHDPSKTPEQPLLVADCKLVTVVISAHMHSSLRFNK
jgi:hypothetical protein